MSRREKLVWPEHSGFASWRRGLWTSWLAARACYRNNFDIPNPRWFRTIAEYCVTEVLICIDMQPYAEVCSILHSYSAFSFQLKLPVFPEILQGSWCREAQGVAVPISCHLQNCFRTSDFRREVCRCVWHFMRAWNIMQCCRESRMSTFFCL